MKANINRIWAWLLALASVFCMGTAVWASPVLDMERLCSVTFTMRYEAAPVPGGSLSLYRVAEAAVNNGFYFRLTGSFADCGQSLEDLQAEGLADRLHAFAQQKAVAPYVTQTVDDTGTVKFDGLPVGLYLAVQSKAADGYSAVAPFLISLPYSEDGQYIYDVEAVPKTELKPTPPPPNIPQTGQLWWPVPICLCGGLALLAVGFALNRRKKTDEG